MEVFTNVYLVRTIMAYLPGFTRREYIALRTIRKHVMRARKRRIAKKGKSVLQQLLCRDMSDYEDAHCMAQLM